jgi:hypothetical protein
MKAAVRQVALYNTLLHKRPDMHYVKHKLVKTTLPSHHVKHHDTRVPPNFRRAASSKPPSGVVRPQLKAGVVGGVFRIEPINSREIV